MCEDGNVVLAKIRCRTTTATSRDNMISHRAHMANASDTHGISHASL